MTELVITSQPEGARVTVDGVGWGVTPLTIRHLPEGTKRIRLTSDGYVAAERVMHVQPGGARTVAVELRRASPSVAEPQKAHRRAADNHEKRDDSGLGADTRSAA